MMTLRATTRILIVLGFVLASRAFAADLDALKDTTPGERAKVQTAMMKERLGLSAEQTPKIGEINLKYAEKMEPIIKGSQGPLMKMRAARGVEEQKEAELKGILSADQFQKFQASKEEMRERFAEKIKEQRAKGGK
jgi:hypothetical protein